MEFDLAKALETLKVFPYPETPRYAVFALLTNYDLLQRPATIDDYVGTFVFVGAFKTAKEAAMHQINISTQTGFPSTITVELGKRRDFGIGPSRDAHIYRDDNEGVKHLMNAIKRVRERNKKITEDIQKEDAERDDPNSMASMSRLLYLAAGHTHHITNHRKRASESEKLVERYENDLVAFYLRNPTMFHTWENTMKPIFAERGESHIFADMKTHFDQRIRGRVESLMVQTIQEESSDDDIGELGDKLVYAGSSSQPEAQVPTSTTELLERELPVTKAELNPPVTRAKAWRDVLVGKTTIKEFESTKPSQPAPSRGTSSEWRSRGRRGRR